VQGTAAFHHQIADALFPQADPVFDEAAALDAPVDRRDPPPTVMQGLVGQLLVQGEVLATGLLGRGMRLSTWGSGNAKQPRSCNHRLAAGKGDGVASAIG
jgi:hypothetical protein